MVGGRLRERVRRLIRSAPVCYADRSMTARSKPELPGIPDPAIVPKQLEDEPPPFLGTWRRLYTGVVVYLFTLITLFYIFTITFGPKR